MMDAHETRRRWRRILSGLVFSLMISVELPVSPARTGDPEPKKGSVEKTDPATVEFFEKNVRPILATRCQGCHGPAKQKGGLRLDARAAILAGGATGPAVVPGNPKESLLVDAINYGETYQMPPKSKLPDQEVATLTRWVEMGAPWGFDAKASPAGTKDSAIPDSRNPDSQGDNWQAVFQARARYWCFQPIRRVTPSSATDPYRWARNPIDPFVLAGLAEHQLSPAPEANRRTLIRRLNYDLTGLPPSPAEVAAFQADPSPDAYERLVDRLLASPHYGERWARHWLDLVRYAETAGHEFDYEILNAFRYRDYVIRAFNRDLPFDQFVVEHLAGDLIENPRRHPAEGFNESVIGTGFYFLGEGTHSPVDVREDGMRRIDNQIDVISKTFLGLTVACARCHDHKFDPIGNRDYYALAGFLRSSRHQQAFIDPPGRIDAPLHRLGASRREIVALLNQASPSLPEPLRDRLEAALGQKKRSSTDRGRTAPSSPSDGKPSDSVFEDFNRDSFDGWSVTGHAFGDRPSRAGDVRLESSDHPGRLISVTPGQAHSGLVSDRLRGVLRSRTFTIENRYIHYRVAGRGVLLNVVVDGFEKIRDPIYGGLTTTVNHGDQPRWTTQDVGMWMGHTAYLEIADGDVADYQGAETRLQDGLGYVAVDEIRMSNESADPRSAGEVDPVMVDIPEVVSALRTSAAALAGRLASAVAKARTIEAQIPDPILALAIADGTGQDEPIHLRGNHKNLGDVVPRRFLQVLGGAGSSSPEAGSGRLELARRVVDTQANPLTARVIVNRLWKHHFGEGIVKSTDDFGAMGRKPSHPELLDWLASELVGRGWSIKAIQRLIVTSSTYRMSSVPIGDAERLDPENVYLHRMNVRRLEAEAIRDGLLAVSGQLVETMYGPSVPTYLNRFMEGRGRPGRSGPLDGNGRRSVYLNVRRNFLNPMFLAFDTPAPFSTMGRRNVSNVPAQALTLMNGPLVVAQARLWAERAFRDTGRSQSDRLHHLFLTAFGRAPTDDETQACLAFLEASTAGDRRAPEDRRGTRSSPDLEAWTGLCHVLINMKEFLFIE
jgi:hypothetical protein